jgi:4-amino-4-deoxychorismate mutase
VPAPEDAVIADREDTAASLDALRTRLDAQDECLLEVVAARLRTCVEIARFKSEHDIPMMQPHRIQFVHDRAERFAVAHGVDPGFLHRLYEAIIAEACRVEDAAMGVST